MGIAVPHLVSLSVESDGSGGRSALGSMQQC